ncbi:MAG: hypothetical protein KBG15_23020 [Kofleriaceae bacterium]|nr:hypothetical protein [Kofleriaceae bacterium]
MAARYETLLRELRVRYPGFRVVKKRDSFLHRAIHYALVGLTFGQMRSYLDSFQTTIGKTVYVTAGWDDLTDDERYVTMRHEAIHLAQFRTFTLPGMAVLYVLLPLPMGVAWFRAYFEKQAYAESVRAAAEVWGIEYAASSSYRAYILAQFSSAAYGWMWPFPASMNRWYDGVLAQVTAELATS